MNNLSDQQLLRDYAEHQSESAFTELVRRHVDPVYSAALRMVCGADLAEDVTQGAFIALAQNARSLADRSVLSGWLHCTARNLAANIVRSETRRRARELEAVAMNHLLANDSDATWENIAPHLDAALGELNDSERDALLLRYFERKSAREIAEILGTTEDAAQKRVNRAVDRLRELFSKRRVAIGAGGLVLLISANSVHSAPVGLATTISTSAALSAVHQATTIGITKALAMTTLQKALVATVIAAAVGTGVFQAHRNSTLQNEIQALQQNPNPLAAQIEQLQRERDAASNQLAAALAENGRLKAASNDTELLKLRSEVAGLKQSASGSATNDPRAALAQSWLAREDRLKQIVEQNPDKTIPEFKLLSDLDWLNAAVNAKLDSEKDIRQTMADLRHRSENDVAAQMQTALSKYMKENHGQFPTDLSQLQSYFQTPLDNAILDRWQIVPQSTLPQQSMGGDWVITEKTPIDRNLDNSWAIGPNGIGNSSYQSTELNVAIAPLEPVLKAYAAANGGMQPTDPSQILPFLTTPEQQAAYQTIVQRHGANSASQTVNKN